MNKQSQEYWDKTHQEYSQQDWINKPSIFAQWAMEYFPKNGRILELGAGQGQDSRFFVEKGYKVVATDFSDKALALASLKTEPQLKDHLEFKSLDLAQTLPFDGESFDVVYAHLSLHYFTYLKTKKIFSEIWRVLKTGGILAALFNSVSDPEYGQGEKIEDDYYLFKPGLGKRFFSVETVKKFTTQLEVILLDNQGTTYKDEAKDVHNLIRLTARKND